MSAPPLPPAGPALLVAALVGACAPAPVGGTCDAARRLREPSLWAVDVSTDSICVPRDGLRGTGEPCSGDTPCAAGLTCDRRICRI